MRTGRADLPLPGGRGPRWLFEAKAGRTERVRTPEGLAACFAAPR